GHGRGGVEAQRREGPHPRRAAVPAGHAPAGRRELEVGVGVGEAGAEQARPHGLVGAGPAQAQRLAGGVEVHREAAGGAGRGPGPRGRHRPGGRGRVGPGVFRRGILAQGNLRQGAPGRSSRRRGRSRASGAVRAGPRGS
ncbi:MAG: hypothetical protein ACK559_16985, partial [bacterium]